MARIQLSGAGQLEAGLGGAESGSPGLPRHAGSVVEDRGQEHGLWSLVELNILSFHVLEQVTPLTPVLFPHL